VKCPKCGGQCRYTEKRKKVAGQRLTKPRTNFEAKCKKCGFIFDARKYYDVVSNLVETKEEKPTQIQMKYNADD